MDSGQSGQSHGDLTGLFHRQLHASMHDLDGARETQRQGTYYNSSSSGGNTLDRGCDQAPPADTRPLSRASPAEHSELFYSVPLQTAKRRNAVSARFATKLRLSRELHRVLPAAGLQRDQHGDLSVDSNSGVSERGPPLPGPSRWRITWRRTLTGISPAGGPPAGDPVTISGTNLGTDNHGQRVVWEQWAATITSDTGTVIMAVDPPGLGHGKRDRGTTTTGGTSNSVAWPAGRRRR